MSTWSWSSVGSLSGRVALVTGANTGLGYETALLLAEKGCEVILACRNVAKAEAAAARIRAAAPGAGVSVEALDLGDLDSVAALADRLIAGRARLDLLINNAGVMVPPLGRTAQGFELQFGTNHLGHFALTARLMPLLLGTAGARVVVVASIAQRLGRIAFDDLGWQRRRYNAWAAYGQSKLANMMFALELSRRLGAAGAGLTVTAAHPGWTNTELQRNDTFSRFFGPYLAMSPREGAMPTLRAALDPEATGGAYYGPAGFAELRGAPVRVAVPAGGRDEAAAARLFDESERLTGQRFSFTAASPEAA
ncbi:MAG: SDR family oxidoreductase [Myxococcales bacterium]|nr:SDR family oxidoreductase [Myxococcales bacterium]